MTYPQNDEQFKDQYIFTVEPSGEGWFATMSDGWSFYIPPESSVTPEPGVKIRMYGKGIGFSVRGLFLNGVKVYYRTDLEEKEHQEIELYGADAAAWLKRWDDGNTCWTIEMGGLGPGYEQCIHITCAEILRCMLAKQYDAGNWSTTESWERDREEIETMSHENKTIKNLGLSGAQWGAALQIAANLYLDGPRKLMTDERLKDRLIQVSRAFP